MNSREGTEFVDFLINLRARANSKLKEEKEFKKKIKINILLNKGPIRR